MLSQLYKSTGKTINIAPNNAEAHYTLAIASYYLHYDKTLTLESVEKARALGLDVDPDLTLVLSEGSI